MKTITQSRLRAWRKCSRMHHLRYVEGWQTTKTQEALDYGTLIHRAIGAFWLGENWVVLLQDSLKTGTDPVQIAKAVTVMDAYAWTWSDRARYEVLAVEAPFRTPVINPETMRASQTYELEGKIDLLLRERATGAVILVEHKSTADNFEDDAAPYWDRIAMDTQLSLYVIGAESLGYQVDKIIYDVVARPSHRPHSATPEEARKYTKAGKLYANQRERDETPHEFTRRMREMVEANPGKFSRRREFARLDNEIREAMADLWHDARMIREAEIAGRAPRNPDACHQYGTCAFYDICAFGTDPSNSSLYRRLDDVNPELAGESTAQVQRSALPTSLVSTLETQS